MIRTFPELFDSSICQLKKASELLGHDIMSLLKNNQYFLGKLIHPQISINLTITGFSLCIKDIPAFPKLFEFVVKRQIFWDT